MLQLQQQQLASVAKVVFRAQKWQMMKGTAVCVCLLLQLQLCNLHKTLFCIKRSYAVLLPQTLANTMQLYMRTYIFIVLTYKHVHNAKYIHTYTTSMCVSVHLFAAQEVHIEAARWHAT